MSVKGIVSPDNTGNWEFKAGPTCPNGVRFRIPQPWARRGEAGRGTPLTDTDVHQDGADCVPRLLS